MAVGCGTHTQRKALIEALVAQDKITGPGRIVPVFRNPNLDPRWTERPIDAGQSRGSCNDQFRGFSGIRWAERVSTRTQAGLPTAQRS